MFSLLVLIASCTNEEKKNTNISQTENIETYQSIEKILSVDNRCIGCTKCVIVAPHSFEMNRSTFKAIVTSQKEKYSPDVQRAIDICPVDSIHIS